MNDFEDYKILYKLGMHNIFIDVDYSNFYKVIDDLSHEFTIYKKEYIDRYNNPVENGYNILEIEYYIKNYHGDLDLIACKSKRI